MYRVLVTGGNGFLGSNIIVALLKKNYKVLVISRECSALTHVGDRIQFVKYSGSYREHSDTIKSFSPNITIHCAWAGGNKYDDVNSTNQFYHNIPAGLELLETLPKGSIFYGVGSFAEYGTLVSPASEQMLDKPNTMYGLSKSTFKNISKMVCDQTDIKWGWVRPCYVYGQGDVATRLVPSLIDKFSRGEDVTLDGCNVKIDYLHVDDFCSGVLKIIDTSSTGVFNVCSGEEYILKAIIELIKKHTNTHSNVTFDNSRDRSFLSKYICGDNTALRSLGWSPVIDIETGIRNLVVPRTAMLEPDFDGLHAED